MADHKITDFVDESAITGLQNLKAEMIAVKDTYVTIAGELLKGLKVPVDGLDQLEALVKRVSELQGQAATATKRHAEALEEQEKIVRKTTAVISEELHEQTQLNREIRQSQVDNEKIKSILEQVNGTYENRLRNLIQVEQEMKNNSAAMKKLEQDFKDGKVSEEAYNDELYKMTKAQRELAVQKSKLQTMLKNEEKEMNSVLGSYNHMSQQLELLKKAYKDLTEEEKASPFGKEMLESIDQLDVELKHQAESMGEHQRNVGNYAVAGESVKKQLKELVLEIATLTVEYNKLSEEEKNTAEGRALAAHIQELTEGAGQLKDAISDTNQAIANAASDTRGFDQLGGSLQLAVDGFGLATGAAEIFGLSTEDVAEVQAKLQAAIAASNAMQSIQNTLQAQSAVMQGVAIVQARARVVAENLHTAAKGKGVIATAALTVAQWAFNAAANANPIGLLVLAITAAIGVVYGLIKAFQAFLGPSKEALEQYQEQKKALDDLSDANDRLIDRMKAMGATEAELTEQMLLNTQRKKEAADALYKRAKELYDEDEDEYKDALEAKKKADEDYEQQKEDSLNYLLKVIHNSEEEEKKERLGTYEYKRQLIQAELEQQKAIAATLLAQEKITREVYENLCASLDKAAQLKIERVNKDEQKDNERKNKKTSGGSRSASSNDPKKQAEDLKKAIEAGEDAILNLIEDSLERQRQAEELSHRRKLASLQKSLSDELAKKKQNAKLIEALNNQILGLEAQYSQKLEDIEISRIERTQKAEMFMIQSRLAYVEEGSKEEMEYRMKALNVEKNMEYAEIYAMERSKTITAEQAMELRADLVLKYAKQETDMMEEYASRQIEAIQDKYSATAVITDNALNKELVALKQKYLEELELAGTNEQKRQELTEQYEAKVAIINEKYAKQKAQDSVTMIEEMLKVEDLSTDERERLARELATAKIELEKAVTDATEAELNRQVELDKRATEKRIKNAEQWMGVAADSLNAINELASAIFDAKISRLDEELEATKATGDKEQEYVSELVSQKVISEEEGEARKRAAAAKTAKKQEEIEKKKQELQHKQAVWDKANNLAQAGIATALAITQALPNIVLAGIVGALGAIQIATILATPIPKYAKGTDYHKGGPAIVGDGGKQEIVSFGGQMYLTPDKPTLIDMPRGAEVFPDADKLMCSLDLVASGKSIDKPQVIVNNDYSALQREVEGIGTLIKKQTRVQQRIAYRADYERFKIARGL